MSVSNRHKIRKYIFFYYLHNSSDVVQTPDIQIVEGPVEVIGLVSPPGGDIMMVSGSVAHPAVTVIIS